MSSVTNKQSVIQMRMSFCRDQRLREGHLGDGKETMMNRKVFKFTCNSYLHSQDRSMNFFWGCNTFGTFNIFLSSLSLSCPLFLYLFNWFEFSNFGEMERVKYRFWFFSLSSLSGSSYCAKLWVHFSIFMTQTLD